jgi:CRP-like cAMP-binding protein
LRGLQIFREFSTDELDFVSRFKTGELAVDAGSTILVEGSHSAHLFTVLAGWGFRYKTLEDGRRQILNYVMPGDLIGLQGTIMGEMQHSIEALSPVTLCVFERDKLMTLYNKHASLAFDLTWIAAREERILDEHLLSIGRRSALERAAYLLAYLSQRASALKLFNGRNFLPITQQHIADTLGLSIVHTNKTLKKLAARGLIRWQERGCDVLDGKALAELAEWEGLGERRRPFI